MAKGHCAEYIRRMRSFLVFAPIALLFCQPASACSVKSGYKIPTNFELVRMASVIVLARVKDVPTDIAAENGLEPMVSLEPVRFLKGSVPSANLKLMGWRAPKNWSGVAVTTTLSQSHFSSGLGACIRQFYEPGELVIAMFEPNSHSKELPQLGLVQLFEPFSREVETVDGPQDIWVHAVDKYVALQAGPSADLDGRIANAIKELAASETPESQAIAEDLRYQLTRKDPQQVWANFSTPRSTTAGVLGHSGAAIYCLAGTPPSLLIFGASPANGKLVVAGKEFEARPAPIAPAEKSLIEPPRGFVEGEKPKVVTVLRFRDPAGLLTAVRDASGVVEMTADGKTLAGGRPLDALVRWGGQCEKLQAVAATATGDLRPAIN